MGRSILRNNHVNNNSFRGYNSFQMQQLMYWEWKEAEFQTLITFIMKRTGRRVDVSPRIRKASSVLTADWETQVFNH